ncbi:MAG: AmmeMemoRadiSam system protein B [Desulfurococcales archaeon]|nr:AmmeMemoRadiSam system protein B [Desulfurococcales archaeon]
MTARIIRRPAHAGTFYPAKREDLIKAIEDSFLHPVGPGRLPPRETIGGRIPGTIGYVVPHAGYIYSGPVAAHAYYDLALREKPDVVVIAGPNHTGMGLGASVFRGDAWETPLGLVPVDNEVARLIVEYTEYFSFDNEAHLYEHSVEVQVPFIQYVLGEVPIVPIVIYVQTLDVARDLGKALARIRSEHGVDLLFIASTDFNHYEPHDITVKKDMIAIDRILDLDDEGLYKALEEYNITMCGPAPAAALINYAKSTGAPKPILLKHATSGDVTGDKTWVVGYASIKFPV